MYRITIVDYMTPNTYKWYSTEKEACDVAKKIIANKDALLVSVYDCKAKQHIKTFGLYD